MRKVIIALATVATLALAGTAAADNGATLAGGATVANGVVTLVSNTGDTSTTNDFSSVTFTLPGGTTFADLKTLSTDYDITDGGCGGGSPRFSVTLADGKNLFAYIGPAPNFNACTLNTWQSSGNLIGNNAQGTWDTSQEIAGTQSSTYSAALAALGTKQVTSVSLVVDAGWAFAGKLQTVLAKNIQVNGTTFPAVEQPKNPKSPAQACKAEQKADPAGFKAKYGSNHNKSNAFGKCVSAKAKAKHHTH